VRTKLRDCSAVIAVAAVVLLGFGSAVATAHGRSTQTIRLTATETQSQYLDLGTPGPSLGDELVFSEVLRSRGRTVGESGVICTVTEVEPPYEVFTFHCVATLSLRRGQITLQGLIEVQGEDDPGPFTVAITGGTGDYRGAGGEAVVRDVSPTRSTYTLYLDPGRRHRR
jgi:hypothetical protein